MPRSEELAIFLPGGQIAPPTNPYGRLIANAGAFRALAHHGGYRRLHFQSADPPAPAQLAEELGLDAAGPEVTTGPLLSTAAAVRAGILLSGQPYLVAPAWARRYSDADSKYSIVGTIFAFASPTHREQMMQSALAPLHEWDALICSSPTLRKTVEHTFDAWQEYLAERLGPGRMPRPQLPVIPFGTDVAAIQAQAGDGAARSRLRESLAIADGDVMVYFLGRLSYYDKAFPQAMFKAVEAARGRSGVRVHFVLAGWFPEGNTDRARFEQAARSYAPTVPVSFLDGNDAMVVASCLAAADVFLLLSDTILETFGQALVEAMAAGLPLVVSDWDGYRFILRDGVDGFLVPTLGAPPGPLGQTLALLQSLDIIGYSQYAGAVAQHTAVHVGAATAALCALLESPELRARMGEAGRARARKLFSWPVVTAQYKQLFAELAALRGSARTATAAPGMRINPLRGDPFADFRHLPTEVMADHLELRLAPVRPGAGDHVVPDSRVELDTSFPGLRGDSLEAHQVIDLLGNAGSLSVPALLASFPPARRPFVRMTVMWLAKLGLVDWRPGN